MVQQIEIILKPKRRGFHLVTSEIVSQLPKLPIFNRLVPENRPEYEHTLEGADDMPAHAACINPSCLPLEIAMQPATAKENIIIAAHNISDFFHLGW